MASTYSVLVVVCLLNPIILASQFIGCFSSPGDLADQGGFMFQSLGHCRHTCRALGQPVLGFTNGTNCLCGNSIPPEKTRVDDSECNLPCPGYMWHMCGGEGFFTIAIEEPVHETSVTLSSTAQPETVQSDILQSVTSQPEASQPGTVQIDTEEENAQTVMNHSS